MNKILAGTIRFLNGLFAFVLVAGGTAIGAEYGGVLGQYVGRSVKYGGVLGGEAAGAFVGFLGGLVIALIICGFLALFIEIRSELIKIRGILEKKPQGTLHEPSFNRRDGL